MRDPYAELHETISALLEGWNERVTYKKCAKRHAAGCPRTSRCPCPASTEEHTEVRRQPGLIAQLIEAQYHPPATRTPGPSGKPASRLPGNLVIPDEILARLHRAALTITSAWQLQVTATGRGRTSRTGAHLQAIRATAGNCDADSVHQALSGLRPVVRAARIALGYDTPTDLLADTVCENCGGALRTAMDATTDVRCAGTPAAPPCGTVYPRSQWVELYQRNHDQPGPILVTTAEAADYTGRTRQVLYRWAKEGRITRHGTEAQALWDLHELPARNENGDPANPPPQVAC